MKKSAARRIASEPAAAPPMIAPMFFVVDVDCGEEDWLLLEEEEEPFEDELFVFPTKQDMHEHLSVEDEKVVNVPELPVGEASDAELVPWEEPAELEAVEDADEVVFELLSVSVLYNG